ncbi:class B sortase [Ellagibacter isourolithinifaciens]|uniref:class B sortase n=1 Tax=Ellagibacter isourolithinifaciens TaxID=2137581 RepID=UPI0023F34E86|nr:class B sortase [Ellagibacter isourolithinifaciens]MDD5925512.1 class B sortase [Ellagibacter isourolithinifaciens]
MRPSTTRFLLGLSAILMATALALTVGLMVQSESASNPSPNPRGQAPNASDPYSGFPAVDWAYWQSVNSDVIGWVTISGTRVDLPICQGRDNDPGYYLTHDVYGNWNIYGCPHLDAACREQGFDSSLCMVFAHHMDDGTMFSALASYSEEDFRQDHPEILLQIPERRMRLSVVAVDVVDASREFKELEFADGLDFQAWWGNTYENCDFRLKDVESEPGSLNAFVTCSYETWNSRTVVYAFEESGETN